MGWWAGFGLAGVGMAAGFVVFVLGKKHLEGKGEPPNPELLAKPILGPINREWLIYGLSILGVGLVWLLVPHSDMVDTALIVSTLASIAVIAAVIVLGCKTWVERQRMMLAVILIFGAVVFFTLFEQAGSSLNLFASTNVDMTITSQAVTFLGIPVGTPDQIRAIGLDPASVFFIDSSIGAAQTQSFNAAFILIFAPVFAALWAYLARRNLDLNPTMKFGLGLLQVGLGFLVVVWGAGLADSSFRVPLMLLGFLYLLHTTGELFLSPVGLSEITKLSLPSVASFMMAVWFLSSSIAAKVGGKIAGLMGTESIGGQVLDPQAAFVASLDGFTKLGWAGVGCGVFFVLISFLVRSWAHETEASAKPEL